MLTICSLGKADKISRDCNFPKITFPRVSQFSEEGIVEIIQNLIDSALEGNITEELLRQDAGIVVGFVSGHPEVFIMLNGGD